MKKVVIVLTIISIMIFSSLLISSNSQDQSRISKIGYVNVEEVAKNYHKWVELNEQYLEDIQFYQRRISRLENEFIEYQQSGATQEQIQQKYIEIQTRIQEYQRVIQEEYSERTDAILNEVQGFVTNYAKENNFDLIVYEAGVVYASDFINITDSIKEIVNQK